MNTQWNSFLTSLSAVVSDTHQVTFADAAVAPSCALHDLSRFGLIEIKGSDSREFLQGQFTNDIRNLTDTYSQLSSHCSAKGRILANFRLYSRDASIFMQIPRDMLALILQRLKLYVLRARVTLEDISDDLVQIGVSGDCAPGLLEQQLGVVPRSDNDVVHHDGISAIRLTGTPARFALFGPAAKIQALWRAWLAVAQPAVPNYWNLLEIEAGLPTIYPQTADFFVPQMLNMQLTNGVSFTKGCYAGQEVVARMQYLGKLKRRMYLADIHTDQTPQPGDELFSPSSQSGQGAGRIVTAEPKNPGEYTVLAVVEIAGAKQNNVTLGQNGPPLKFRDLPYSLPESEENPAG